jgi:carbon storage regulator
MSDREEAFCVVRSFLTLQQGGTIMLVLTRRIGEEIVIGEDIHVAVLAIQGEKVRLGVVAPPDVQVDRQEVRDRRLAGIPKPQAAQIADLG